MRSLTKVNAFMAFMGRKDPAKSSATSPRGRTSPSPSLASTRSRAASAIILNLIFVFQTDEKYLNVDVPEKR